MGKEKPAILDLDNKKLWNTSEVALFLGRSEGAIRNLVLRRAIPFRKPAGRLAFLNNEIRQWIDQAPGVRLEDLEE